MPSLPADAKELLEEPITLPELQLALSNAKTGKAPCPDGFTIPYYKTLFPSLGHHLVKLFNDLSLGAKVHISTLQAQISVIPKEGKDLAQCGSYRPISLLNTDLKLFTKIIASILQQTSEAMEIGIPQTQLTHLRAGFTLQMDYHGFDILGYAHPPQTFPTVQT